MKLNPLHLPSVTFACGPAQGLKSVRESFLYQTHFERNHRSDDISALYHETELLLRQLLNVPEDFTLLFFPGGATAAMDAILWSLTDNSVSGLNMGAFSRLWCDTLAARLPEHIQKHFVKTDLIPQALPPLEDSLVILTPNETSTGVQLRDEFLLHAWENRGPNTLIAWDTTSCAGGRVLPNAYDVQLFGLQKCFAAGGGTCCVILSPKAVARAHEVANKRKIPYFLDLTSSLAFVRHAQTLNTPSTSNIWMTRAAAQFMLENGGLAEMEKWTLRHSAYLVRWAEQTDWVRPLVTDEKYRSFTTLTLQITNPLILDEQINAAMAQTGLPNLQDGLKKYRSIKTNSLRAACFPFVGLNSVREQQKLTQTLDEIVGQLG